jgi:hypothetical protein
MQVLVGSDAARHRKDTTSAVDSEETAREQFSVLGQTGNGQGDAGDRTHFFFSTKFIFLTGNPAG